VRWKPLQGVEGQNTPDRLKSCQIVPSLEARHGGPSKSVAGLSASFARLGSEVELLATDPSEGWRTEEGRLDTHVFHRDWPTSVCSSSGLRRYLATNSADIVHHHSIWLRTLHYAQLASDRLKVPFVISPRGMMDPWAWNHHSRKKALARTFIHPGAFEAASGWHATSEAEADSIRSLGFQQPICVAPNGIDEPVAADVEASRAYWRDILGTAERPVALFYSRLHRKKRLLELIDAWLENGPKDWLLLLVGIPEDYSPQMLEAYVLNTGNSGRVRVYNGAGRPPPYPVASLFLLPSHGENFGQSIAESLAYGVPALVTDTTPWEALNGNGAGWCVPWSQFPSAIKAATSEGAEALARRGVTARDWVLQEYSWLKPANLLLNFYSGLKSGQGTGKP
jgi:glycosyltransferase involved in cell wall biosynthesis